MSTNVPKPAKPKYLYLVKFEEDFSKRREAVFEYHTEENCISNHFCCSKKGLQSFTIDEECEESSSPQATEENINRNYLPLDRSNSLKGIPKSKEDMLNSQILIRKEALRFVTNLCSSLSVKASEQGLLNLKQKFPQAFQDICLYSEICYYMADYNFRLSARRFMQELFLDVAFEQLQYEAESIVGITGIPQIGGSEV